MFGKLRKHERPVLEKCNTISLQKRLEWIITHIALSLAKINCINKPNLNLKKNPKDLSENTLFKKNCFNQPCDPTANGQIGHVRHGVRSGGGGVRADTEGRRAQEEGGDPGRHLARSGHRERASTRRSGRHVHHEPADETQKNRDHWYVSIDVKIIKNFDLQIIFLCFLACSYCDNQSLLIILNFHCFAKNNSFLPFY